MLRNRLWTHPFEPLSSLPGFSGIPGTPALKQRLLRAAMGGGLAVAAAQNGLSGLNRATTVRISEFGGGHCQIVVRRSVGAQLLLALAIPPH